MHTDAIEPILRQRKVGVMLEVVQEYPLDNVSVREEKCFGNRESRSSPPHETLLD